MWFYFIVLSIVKLFSRQKKNQNSPENKFRKDSSMVKLLVEKFEQFIKIRVGQLKSIENITQNLNNLPKFYRNKFNLYNGKLIINDSIKGLDIIIIEVKNNFTDINTLKNQITTILKISNGEITQEKYILLFSSLENTEQRLLIKNNIPYYSERNPSIYLPFIYLELQSKLEVLKKFTPSEQLIFCYLMKNINSRFTQKKLEIKLGLSKSIVQKSLKKFEQLDILERGGYTKNLEYKLIMNRKEIFDIIKDYLINPIRKKIYIEKTNFVNIYLQKGVISSETALSDLTLYDSNNIKNYALEKKMYKNLELELVENNIIVFSRKTEVKLLSQSNEIISIEEWSYDPNLIKDQNNCIDIISLYNVLKIHYKNKEENDDRLLQELEILLEDYLNEC